MTDEVIPSAAALAARSAVARSAWLAATRPEDLNHVELELKAVIESTKLGTKQTGDAAYRPVRDTARQRLLLLLCQAGRDDEAIKLMRKASFLARLSPGVLNYSTEPHAEENNVSPTTGAQGDEVPPLLVLDHAVPQRVLADLDRCFTAVDAAYWTYHGYTVEPPTPYFSYAVPIEACQLPGSLGPLGALVRCTLTALAKFKGVEAAAKVKFAELWAHNRPHPSGHQMHFDSDDEGRLGIRNPVVSSVVYLTSGTGGPTVVTDQKLTDTSLARRGWAALPRRGRLVVFDGSVLHGVVPGKGLPPPLPGDEDESARDGIAAASPRRVTVMLALWEELRARTDPGFGSSRPLPPIGTSEWVELLTRPYASGDAEKHEAQQEPAPSVAIPSLIEPVWVDMEMNPWPTDRRMPPYERAFQGF
jgi:hypothetical protein